MRTRAGVAAGALAAIALIVLFHNAALRLGIAAAARLATGYTVRMDSLHFSHGHGALTGVRVTRGGQPVFEADRVDVYYSLRDLLPGSKHRYG
ncbi:MAG: hypothetical protein JOZ01_07205, partial [Candidatus Eremiobacteraeota bacterium]|nr:hypothetical protein [Candidatus Eremiobacteraeota bacterium]